MRHVEHHPVRSSALDECLHLILQVFGLLARQSRHRKGAAKSLRGYTVAGLAIVRLGLWLLRRDRARWSVLRMRRGGNNGGVCRQQYRIIFHEHASVETTLRFAAQFDPAHFLKTLISINGCFLESGVLARWIRMVGAYRDEMQGFAGVDCCICDYRNYRC